GNAALAESASVIPVSVVRRFVMIGASGQSSLIEEGITDILVAAMLANLPRAPFCCLTASTSFCAPPGCAGNATEARPDIAAPIAVCVLLLSYDASNHIGCQELLMSETRLTAMGLPPLSLNWEQPFGLARVSRKP